jgi:uncharacterized membrane protein
MTVTLAVVAALLFVFNLFAIRKAAELQTRLEDEEQERERAERMANEMLRERSREDVARDMDAGRF